MNWLDGKIWKHCLISTFICLMGCSIGAMGTSFYLINLNLVFVLAISLIVGFVTCVLFMILWYMLFNKMNFKDSFQSSYKMSLVSILIMMLTENIILLFIIPKFSSHQMHMDMSAPHDFKTMLLAMGFGFALSLPYNYYHLQKTGKICHENQI